MKHSTPPPTKADQERFALLRALGCIPCKLIRYAEPERIEIQHMLDGNRRMGHLYTIPYCVGHHQGRWSARQLVMIPDDKRVSISDGKKAFTRIYGPERAMWERVQKKLGLSVDWPMSKILPRRVA